MKNMAKSVSVRLPDATLELLEHECKLNGMTASAVVRTALDHYLAPAPAVTMSAPERRRFFGGRRAR